MKKIIFSLFLLWSALSAQFIQPDVGELRIRINKLSELGSVLYIAAHPDDENTALLSYFTKEKLYRTGYLSITRGEGGQNAIGSELGVELGVIRTQELLAARRIDGAEQFFTRAIDFGYSKSADETLRLWNKDSVLSDVVWVIRKFRPDIIITRFSPTQGGHGQHLASAILAQEAFRISGDPAVFPEQLRFVRPWKAKRILFNHFRYGGANSNPQNLSTIKIDVGAYNPLLGKSYTELAGISRSMHKSQAMGSSQNKGSSMNEFIVTDGMPAQSEVMEGINGTWNRFPGGSTIIPLVRDVRKSFNPEYPYKSIPALLKLNKALQKVNNDPLIQEKMNEVESLIRSCAGLWIEANARRDEYIPGDSVHISLSAVNRSPVAMKIGSIFSTQLNIDNSVSQPLKNNEPFQWEWKSVLPLTQRYTQPYWLAADPVRFRYATQDYAFIGSAENPSPLSIDVTLQVEKELMMFHVPVQFKWVDDIDGEKRRSVVIVPRVSVSISEKNIVCTPGSPAHTVNVSIRSNDQSVTGTVRLQLPNGWKCSPDAVEVRLSGTENAKEITFTLRPDSLAENGVLTALMQCGTESFSSEVKTIRYGHFPQQTLLETSGGKVLDIDLAVKGASVGYIMGAGDEVPNALRQMGYAVSLISDEELRSNNFSRYDAVIAGIRAYNTRTQLRQSHASLLKYVENGGTYIVQYQVLERGQTDDLGPYPMTISRERVTDEDATMTFIAPQHALLNVPNKITQQDFSGWVQERGLYFVNTWDSRYETIISCADPNEQQLAGSLLAAHYGKGHFIFTVLSFFRQLPAGVPGAYRLFANLVSFGK